MLRVLSVFQHWVLPRRAAISITLSCQTIWDRWCFSRNCAFVIIRCFTSAWSYRRTQGTIFPMSYIVALRKCPDHLLLWFSIVSPWWLRYRCLSIFMCLLHRRIAKYCGCILKTALSAVIVVYCGLVLAAKAS